MKKLLFLLLLILTITSLFSCGNKSENENNDISNDINNKLETSQGLEFKINKDNQGYTLVGIGTCTDSDIIIDKYNNLPITYIEKNAFFECDSIKSITFGDSITSIGENAFCACTQLSNIKFGNNLKKINDYAFRYCFNLTSITIPESVTQIGKSAFDVCPKLVEVINHSSLNIEKGSKDFGGIAYYALKVHTGKSEIDKKDDFIFYSYENTNYLLGYTGNNTILVLPQNYNNNPYEIYTYAFANQINIISITIPEGVTNIHDEAFMNSNRLFEVINKSSLSIEKGAETFGEIAKYAFKVHAGKSEIVNQNNYIFFADNGTNYLISYIGNDKDIVLPEDYNGQTYEIYSRAFTLAPITNVTIPNTVTNIAEYAFTGSENLTTVTLGDGITQIGKDAFANCPKLTTVNFGTNLTNISSSAFSNCTLLTDVSLPKSLTNIGSLAFSSCSSITSITIPENVTHIGEGAFAYCANLTNIDIPDNITTVGTNAFGNCNKLPYNIHNNAKYLGTAENPYMILIDLTNTKVNSISVHKDTKIICDSALSFSYSITDITVDTNNNYYTSIDGNLYTKDKKTLIKYAIAKEDKSFTIPNSVTTISHSAFENCSNLEIITIPNSVTTIMDLAFSNCRNLSNIALPESITTIGDGAFKGCQNITEITIPDSVINLETEVFNSCTNLKNVIIGKGITTINEACFFNCKNLSSITIPKSITNIQKLVFYDCSKLTNVKFENVDNWNADGTAISSSDLTNETTAAQYLTKTHVLKTWTKY